MSTTQEQILSDLAEVLRNWEGREYSGTIGPRTLFFGELGMVSIDAVVLAETLEKRYGRKFPFNQLLANLARRLRELFDQGRLCLDSRTAADWNEHVDWIVPSYIHMMSNRLGVSIQEESYLSVLIAGTLGQGRRQGDRDREHGDDD